MITIKATTENGNPIEGQVRHKLTKNGKIFIDFWERPRNIKKIEIKARIEVPGNSFILDLDIQDIEAKFPCKLTGRIIE